MPGGPAWRWRPDPIEGSAGGGALRRTESSPSFSRRKRTAADPGSVHCAADPAGAGAPRRRHGKALKGYAYPPAHYDFSVPDAFSAVAADAVTVAASTLRPAMPMWRRC